MQAADHKDEDEAHLVVGQASLAREEHLGMVVEPEWRLAVRTDVGLEAHMDHLRSRLGRVEQSVRCSR